MMGQNIGDEVDYQNGENFIPENVSFRIFKIYDRKIRQWATGSSVSCYMKCGQLMFGSYIKLQ